MRAVLFDIDGTLIRLDGAGRRALTAAAADVCELPVARVRAVVEAIDFRGATDAGILREMSAGLAPAGAQAHDGTDLGDGDGFAGRVVARYLELLPGSVRDADKTLLPGVVTLIERLENSASRCVVGLLTGNVRAGARIKLEAFGLGRLAARPGGFGEDGRTRSDVARAAVRRLGAEGVPAGRTVIIGDTEHDVSAARAAGARTIAVETGWTDRETLAASEPDLLLADLSDPARVLELVDALR